MSAIWDTVILGCGQLGGNLKRNLEASGHRVLGVRRTRSLDDQTMMALNLDNTKSWQRLADLEISSTGVLIGIMTPDERTEKAYRKRYVGVANQIAKFLKFRTQSLVWVSSTGVFGEAQTGELDEETLPSPDNWRGNCLLEAEAVIRQSSKYSSILRCAGLYTETSLERLLSHQFRSKLNPNLVANRIHRDDVVSWLSALVKGLHEGFYVPPVVHGVDECPALYQDIFRYLDGETGSVHRAKTGRRIVSLYREQMPALYHPEIKRFN